jgi:acylphosphatase
VEAVFEGEKASIGEAIRACRQGPPASKVDDIEVKWEEHLGEFQTFSVRYF